MKLHGGNEITLPPCENIFILLSLLDKWRLILRENNWGPGDMRIIVITGTWVMLRLTKNISWAFSYPKAFLELG